jgi:hypothetical protein
MDSPPQRADRLGQPTEQVQRDGATFGIETWFNLEPGVLHGTLRISRSAQTQRAAEPRPSLSRSSTGWPAYSPAYLATGVSTW